MTRYKIDQLKEKVRDGYMMTSREVAQLALLELVLADYPQQLTAELHIKRAEVYARIAQALKSES